MAKVTPDQAAEKWQRRLSGATQDVTAGVQAVTQAPGIAAARQVDAWINGVQAARNKWVNRVQSVSLSDWQAAMINKGVPRIASGAQAAQPKMAAFMTEFLPFLDRVTSQVHSMPKGGIENGIARAVAQIRGTAQFQRGGTPRAHM